MHDCPVSAGDTWARENLTGYVQWARAHSFHIATVLVGPMVRAGNVAGTADHDTLLRTLEDMYGLPALGGAAHPLH